MTHIFVIFLFAVTLLFSSCRQKTFPEDESLLLKSEQQVHDANLEIFVNRDNLELSDTLRLTVQVTVPAGLDCQLEGCDSSLQGFRLKSENSLPWCQKSDSRWIYRLSLEAEPLIAENHRIETITANISATSQDGATSDFQLRSQPFEIQITMPPQETWDNLTINDQDGMETIRSCKLSAWLMLPALALLLAAVSLILFWKFREKSPQAVKLPPPVPAHLTALRLLDELLAENLPRQGQFKLFYQRISNLTRVYIEERFEIRAPELTTEEFLRQLSDRQTALAAHRQSLERFLAFCDLVKFAEHTPQDSDILQTAEACRAFIITTSSGEN